MRFRSETPTQRQGIRNPRHIFSDTLFFCVSLGRSFGRNFFSSPAPSFSVYPFSRLVHFLQKNVFITYIAKYIVAETISKILLHSLRKDGSG